MKKISLFVVVIGLVSIGLLVSKSTTQSSSMESYLLMENEELNSLPRQDRPDLAELQNFEMTRDPSLGYPPVERLMKAYQDIKRNKYIGLKSKSYMPVSSANWTERGPNNFGGRTRGLVFDPSDTFSKKVWAAGVGGGLWYNDDITDPNSAWKVVDDFFGNIAITSIAFDNNNTDTMYFGTGEGWFNADAIKGNGIWKSTDGGISWSQLASTTGQEFDYIQKIVVTSSSTVIASTREGGGIYRSTDGGSSWTRVIDELRGADIEVVGDIVYASTGIFTTGKLWKSTDDGVTWEQITLPIQGERIEIGVNENHPSTVYTIVANGSNVAGVFRSFDSGTNWETVTTPNYTSTDCSQSSSDFTRGQAWYDLIIAVDPTDRNTIVVGGIDLNKSTDGGESWDLISYWTGNCDDYVHADQHNFIFSPTNPNIAIASTDGGVYFTNNFSNPISSGGPDFSPRNLNYNVTQFYACAMENVAGSDYFLAGAQDNGSHQFFNPGVNSTNEITGGDGAFCFIDQDNSDIQITSYVYNSYWITKDNWATNDRVETPSDRGRFINPADYNSNINMLFAAGNANMIIRYDINASTLAAEEMTVDLAGQSISAVTVSKYDDDIVYVGTSDGGVFKLSGVSGTSITSTLISTSTIPSGSYISSIDVGSSDNELIATVSNYGVESVFLTQDGGASWVSKEGDLPDIPVRWALFNPSNFNEVLIATELGVWITSALSDTSPTWTTANDGLANVRCDMLQYREADGLVAVATHGRGLFTSDVFATQSLPNFYNPDVAYVGQSVSFTNASIKSNSYNWDFGGQGTSTLEDPTFTFSTPGIYTVTLEINGDNSLTKSSQIAVLPYVSNTFTLAMGGDFESNQDYFYGASTDGASPFELGSSAVVGKDGTNSGSNAWVTDLDAMTYASNGESFLYTPQFDFSVSGEYTLEFYTKYAIEDEWDGFIIEYSLDNGNSWIKLSDYLDASNWYNQEAINTAVVFTGGEPIFSGDTGGQYVKKSTTFSELSANAKVAFRFAFRTDPASEEAGVAIDDFQLTVPPASAPTLSFTNSTDLCVGSIIEFTNSSTGSIDSYSWDFGIGATPQTAVGYGPHQVVYSSGGTKDVTLTVTSSFGNTSTTNQIEITSQPIDISLTQTNFEICQEDSVKVSISNPEAGVTYSLIDSQTQLEIDKIISDGTAFDFTLKGMSIGTFQYEIDALGTGGCSISFSDVVSLTVNEVPVAEITQLDRERLRSSVGDSYQWFVDGETIPGATDRILNLTDPGSYTVEVTLGSCSAISTPIEITSILSVNDIPNSRIYPNPVVDIIYLDKSRIRGDYEIKIFNLSGSLVYHKNCFSVKKIDVSVLEPGIYHLVQKSNTTNSVKKWKFRKK